MVFEMLLENLGNLVGNNMDSVCGTRNQYHFAIHNLPTVLCASPCSNSVPWRFSGISGASASSCGGELVQPGNGSHRLLLGHLGLLAPGIESPGAPLVSTPLPLPYSIAVNGPTYRVRSSRIKLSDDTFFKVDPFCADLN